MMRDPAQSTFAFVMYPEVHADFGSLARGTGIGDGRHPARTGGGQYGHPARTGHHTFAQARRSMQEKYLAEIGERFATPVLEIPLLPQEVKGLEMLAELGEQIYQTEAVPAE